MDIDIDSTYCRYGPMVLRRCQRLLADPQKAEDAMQDVFVQLLLHQERLHGGALSSLLYRIATHVCLNRLRSERRRPEDPNDELLCKIANTGDPENQSAARHLLDKLFGRDSQEGLAVSSRVIATLHLHDGLTLQEVARETGLSVSGIRKRLRGIQKRLHELQEVA